MEGAKLEAVCDTVPERTQPYVDRYGCRAYDDLGKMLADPQIDVVCICTPSGLHAQMGVAAAYAKKHVVVEKPLTLSLEDADAMIAAAEQNGVWLAVVHPNRFLPGVVALRQQVEQGAFGTFTHAAAVVRWNRNQAYYDSAPWRGTAAMDGGFFLNQAIHNIDLLQWMMGPVEEVFAYTTTRLRKIETEDLGVAVLRFQNGALGTIEAAGTLYPQNLEESLALFGETGSAKVGGRTIGTLENWEFANLNDEETQRLVQQVNQNPKGTRTGHQAILSDMVQAVREHRPPLINGREARKALEIVLAIYQSSREHRPVRLPLPAPQPASVASYLHGIG